MDQILEVGSLDLSSYLNVQKEEGMDTSNPAFSERIFSHSLLKEGGTLALENLNLKELIFPLILSAPTDEELKDLVRELNREVNATGQTCKWQDYNAEDATFFDLASGQFDVAYDFRENQQHYAKGRLRLFAQPFGRGIIPKAMGFTEATLPVAILPIATALRGDAAGLPVASITYKAPNQFVAFGVLPQIDYVPQFLAPTTPLEWSARLYPGEGSVVGATNAVASVCAHTIVGVGNTRVVGNVILPAPTAYIGENRVLALMRIPSSAGASISLRTRQKFTGLGNISGPTAYTSKENPAEEEGWVAQAWHLVDLGTINVPTGIVAPATAFNIEIVAGGNSSATSAVDLTAVVVLPDNGGPFFNIPEESGATSTFVIDSLKNTAIRGATVMVPVNEYMRGPFPKLAPSPYAVRAEGAFYALQAGNSQAPRLTKTAVTVAVYERCRWVF